jgi:hypothetical protein
MLRILMKTGKKKGTAVLGLIMKIFSSFAKMSCVVVRFTFRFVGQDKCYDFFKLQKNGQTICGFYTKIR